MLEFGNKEWRNLQEQVGKNKEDIKTLKSGIKIEYEVATITDLSPLLTQENVGKYVLVRTEQQKLYLITKRANEGLIAVPIGNFPEVVEGPKGDKGDKGEQGDNGTKVGASSGTTLPSPNSYKEGDLFILGTGMLYKLVQGKWYAQCDLKGPQGLRGPQGTAVTANPVEEPSDVLTKVKIDGITYDINKYDEDGNLLLGRGLQVRGNANNLYFYTYGGEIITLAEYLDEKENVNRKVGNLDNPNNYDYPTTKAVKDYVDIHGSGLTPAGLLNILEGSETVVVDESEDGEHVEVHLDADVVNKIENSLQLPLTHTERKIVTVNTAGSQEMIGIGDGLGVEAGKIKALGGNSKLYCHSITLRPFTTQYCKVNIISTIARPLTFGDFYNQEFYIPMTSILFQDDSYIVGLVCATSITIANDDWDESYIVTIHGYKNKYPFEDLGPFYWDTTTETFVLCDILQGTDPDDYISDLVTEL